MPSGSTLIVTLEALSRTEVVATPIAEINVPVEGDPPFAFSMPYAPSGIDEQGQYSLRVRITGDRQLRFMSTEHHDPFADGDLEVLVSRVTAQRLSPQPDVDLLNTYWKLNLIDDSPVQAIGEGREPHLRFSPDESVVSGHAGCNRFSGGFELNGDEIRLGPLAATRMYCEDTMAVEDAYLQALERVAGFRIFGPVLSLLDDQGQLVLQFESVYF